MPRIQELRTGGLRGVGVWTPEMAGITPEVDNTGKSYAYIGGRIFDYWIDLISGGARSNGYNKDDQVFIAPYIIESLLRDEKLSIRDLNITTVTDTTHIIVSGLASSENDYYNYATYYNATTLHKTYVTDYVGATKTLVLNDADTAAVDGTLIDSTTTSATTNKLNDSGGGFSGVVQIGMIAFNDTDATETTVTAIDSDTVLSVADDIFANAEDYRISDPVVGDNIFLQNVRGDTSIDYASFDVLGNTSGGTRQWTFNVSLYQKMALNQIIDTLAFESHCEFIKSCNETSGETKYRLIAIDTGAADTWTNPVYQDGLEQIKISFTPLEGVFTGYKFYYAYDIGANKYTKELSVDKNGYTTTAAVIGATEQALCQSAEDNYSVRNIFEYSSLYIQSDTIAEYFLQKKIAWFTKQRMIVSFRSSITSAAIDFIKYEIGDRIKINFTKGLPTGVTNATVFMITGKRIAPLVGGGYIDWELIEL